MPVDTGIRMKVLRNGGQLLDDHGMDPCDEDEFQNLIVLPRNYATKGKTSLRLMFLGLMSLSIASILFIIVKDYTQMAWLMQPEPTNTSSSQVGSKDMSWYFISKNNLGNFC